MLLTINGDAKTVKGLARQYMTGILYFAPSDLSGRDVCPHASEGCKTACLFSAGRGAYPNVKASRIHKTLSFFADRKAFTAQLLDDISKLSKRVSKKGFNFAVRLNGTSDLPWENIKIEGKSILEHFPNVQFYDYTKNLTRMLSFLNGKMPANYHLTFSRSEKNQDEVKTVLLNGGNVAVVFSKPFTSYLGKKVVDGDQDDLRFLDPKGVVVGLKAKGKAKKDKSGFVVYK